MSMVTRRGRLGAIPRYYNLMRMLECRHTLYAKSTRTEALVALADKLRCKLSALRGTGKQSRRKDREAEMDDDRDEWDSASKRKTVWEDIHITGRDKLLSEKPKNGDKTLRRQVFSLSRPAPEQWVKLFNDALLANPLRKGRQVEATALAITVWGGPNKFNERDAHNLQNAVIYANYICRDSLEPGDFSGFDAFDK